MRRLRALDVALALSTAGTTAAVVGGTDLPAGGYFLALVIGYAGFGAYLAGVRRRPRVRTWPVLVASGLLLVASMVRPPIESGDVWSYSSYGRMVAHYHQSPWTHTPADHPDDPYTRRVVHFWVHTPSVYGPAFAPPAAAVMSVAGEHPSVARVGFQLLAALSIAAAIWLVGRETGWNPGAVAVIGLNPLIAVSVVNGAHNDAWCGLLLLIAVLLARRRRWAAAGLIVALAGMIKVTAVLAVLGLVVWAWRRAGLSAALKLAGAACGVVAVLVMAAGGSSVVRAMTWNSSRMTGSTVWAWARHRAAQGDLTTAAVLAVVALAAFLVLRHRRASDSSLLIGLTFIAYLLLSAYVWPWYAVWGLIPLALCWWAPTTRLLVAMGMVLELAAVPGLPDLSHRSPGWALPLDAAGLIADSVPFLLGGLAVVVVVVGIVRWRSSDRGPAAVPRWPVRRTAGPVGLGD